MKKMMIISLLALIVSGCGSKSEKSESKSEGSPVEKYLAVKDALILTDAREAQKAASAFLAINKNDALQASLETIAGTTNVAVQRKAFEALSESMYSFVKTKGAEVTLYKQYCPMAFNNKGAYWLSAEKRVDNPYFGDRMLHCGSVQEVIEE